MAVLSKPLIIVVSAPSGSGKTTLVSNLIERVSGVIRSVSYTTRKPRDGEENGRDYFFVSEEDFRDKLKKNDFIEWEENFGKYYGTSKEQIFKAQEAGLDIVLSIDVRGAERVRKEFSDAISIFVMPPSIEELKKRLEGRNTDTQDVVKKRLSEAKREMDAVDLYDHMIVNDVLEDAVDALIKIVKEERNNREKQKR